MAKEAPVNKTFTREDLARFNGKNGARAYIAHQGKVYDVTDSPLWESGDHNGVHEAGWDLTDSLAEAPHQEEVLEGLPVVGTLAG